MITELTDLPPEILHHISQFVRITDLPAWTSTSKKIKNSYTDVMNLTKRHDTQKIGFLVRSLNVFYQKPKDPKNKRFETFLAQNHDDADKILFIALYLLWQHCLSLNNYLDKNNEDNNKQKTALEKLMFHFQAESSKNLELSLITPLNPTFLTNSVILEAKRLRFFEQLVSYNNSIKHTHLGKIQMIFPLVISPAFLLILLILLPFCILVPLNQSLKIALNQCLFVLSAAHQACCFLNLDIEKTARNLLKRPYAIDEMYDELMTTHNERLTLFESLRIIKSNINHDALTDFRLHQLEKINLN